MEENRESTGKNNPPKHTQFQPGQSGNPNGRPKGKAISTVLKGLLDGTTKIEEAGVTRELTINEAVALKLVQKALDGDIKAIREVFDRTEGKAPQSLEVHNINEPRASAEVDYSTMTMEDLQRYRDLLNELVAIERRCMWIVDGERMTYEEAQSPGVGETQRRKMSKATDAAGYVDVEFTDGTIAPKPSK